MPEFADMTPEEAAKQVKGNYDMILSLLKEVARRQSDADLEASNQPPPPVDLAALLNGGPPAEGAPPAPPM